MRLVDVYSREGSKFEIATLHFLTDVVLKGTGLCVQPPFLALLPLSSMKSLNKLANKMMLPLKKKNMTFQKSKMVCWKLHHLLLRVFVFFFQLSTFMHRLISPCVPMFSIIRPHPFILGMSHPLPCLIPKSCNVSWRAPRCEAHCDCPDWIWYATHNGICGFPTGLPQ